MADPSMKKSSTIGPGSPPVVDPRTIMTPAYNTPAQSVADREPAPPPVYAPGTVHRPPPSDHTSPSEPEDDYKTININITINVPSSFRFPCWRRCKRRHQDPPPPPPPHSIQGIQARSEIPRAEKKRRFLAVVVALFYLSFVVCGAVAWGIKEDCNVWSVPVAPLILETFTPFLDLFVLFSTIVTIKRHQDNDKLGFRFFILSLLNFGLFVLHLVVLILAAIWCADVDNNRWRGPYYTQPRKEPIANLMLYNTSTLIVFKFILFIAILRKRAFRQKFTQGVSSIPAFIGQEYRYHSLTSGVDEDATGINSARNSTDQGRVYLA